MPLARYFLYVGGVLLALLFVADAWLPMSPPAGDKIAHLPAIRIHADDRWPGRIEFDTSAPIHVTRIANSEIINPPAPPPPSAAIPPVLREALAQLRPSEADTRSKHARQEPKRPRKIARKHLAWPVMLAARRSPYGWFGPTIW
jgi:hypothetical protein